MSTSTLAAPKPSPTSSEGSALSGLSPYLNVNPPKDPIVNRTDPSAVTQGVIRNFGEAFSLDPRRADAISNIRLQEKALTLGQQWRDEKKWDTALSECISAALERGAAARLDASLFKGLPSIDALHLMLRIQAAAQSAGLDLSFHDVPQGVLGRLEHFKKLGCTKLLVKIDEPSPSMPGTDGASGTTQDGPPNLKNS